MQDFIYKIESLDKDMWNKRPQWVLIKKKYLNKGGFEWITEERKIEFFFVNEIETSKRVEYIRVNNISGIRNIKIVGIKRIIDL